MRGGRRALICSASWADADAFARAADDLKWFDPAEIALGGMSKLALPGGSRYRPLGVLRFAYERLRLVLRIAGYDSDFHHYDWRLDFAGNGRVLAERLVRERRQDVVLVGHSMGGLVARAALACKSGERIGRVIQLGTPNRGAFVAVQALRGTYPLVRRLAMLDLLHDAEELAHEVLTTFPGLCGLLPPASACKDFDPFDAARWPEGPRPAAVTLTNAHQAIEALPPPDERFALIAGFGQDTVLGLRRRGQRIEFGRGPAGDGTVPLALAHWPGLPSWYAEESHGALPGNADVGRAVIDLAGGETTTALPHVLPRRRGVPTLWEEDTRVAPPAKIACRPDRAAATRVLHEFRSRSPNRARVRRPSRSARIRPRPVELAFIEGGVTQSDASALVLGAFANVEPAGAALAVDTMLHGAISDLARRRAISAAAGEVFVLPVGRRGLAARLVVFAGLGDFGLWRLDIQRLAAANVTCTLALAGIGDFAMVLWARPRCRCLLPHARAARRVLTALADLAPNWACAASRSCREARAGSKWPGLAARTSAHASGASSRGCRPRVSPPASSASREAAATLPRLAVRPGSGRPTAGRAARHGAESDGTGRDPAPGLARART
jgi:hypothetical protein